MASQVQNEPNLQYGHLPLPDKSNVSSLNEALRAHLGPAVGARSSYSDSNAYRGLTASPTSPQQNNATASAAAQQHPQQTSSMVNFAAVAPLALKRKPVSESTTASPMIKKRRDGEDGNGVSSADGFDGESGAHGSKHWKDDEKTKLFEWLMAPGHDDRWNALRATKNSCLRECAIQVFDGKKTYQALKGCYERNFNLFKQIYACEMYNAQIGSPPVSAGLPEADRLRQNEQRLQAAKRAGCDLGNISARTIDTWHRNGWYNLFCSRWHGDPATTRPTVIRHSNTLPSSSGGAAGEDLDVEDDPALEYPDQHMSDGGNLSPDRIAAAVQQLAQPPPPLLPPPSHLPKPTVSHAATMQPPPASGSAHTPTISDQTLQSLPSSPSEPNMTISIPQSMFTTYLHLLQTQTQTAKLKLEYMRRREEQDRENSKVKQRAELATELLANPSVDGVLRETVINYLKGLFRD